jgi:non-specific protein-tyrosine kinase
MEDGSLEFKRYWRLFLRWWWLVVLGTAGAAAAAYYVSDSTIPIYDSQVKVLVERHELPGAPSQGDIKISQDLAQNYVDLIETRPVLEKVAQRLPVKYGLGLLEEKISPSYLRNIITISASDPDPKLAAVIANATADTFIRELQDRQLSQLSSFQQALTEYGIKKDDSILAAQAAMLGVLTVVEPAVPPPEPSNIHTVRNVLVAAAVGLLVSSLGVLLIGYLDDKIKSPEDLKTVTGLVPLGSIPRFKSRNGASIDSVGGNRRFSPLLESYKVLWTNLEFASRNNTGLKTLLVTSAGISEGKTATAANLAVSVARQGKSVILVDSNLRRPSLHQIFDLGVGEHKGLTQVLTGDASLEEALLSTPVEGLRVMTSGSLDLELGLALSSPDMKRKVQELKQRADLVIFDSPSLLAVSDAMLLASLVDQVLLVVDVRRTSRAAVKQALERLSQVNTHIVGAVLNKVSGQTTGDRYLRHYRKNFEKNHNNQFSHS